MVKDIERKKNLLIFMIVAMVLVIFAMGLRFQNKLNNSVLVHNDLKTLETFKASDTGFSYKLPYNWQYKENYIKELDLAYYNSFSSEDSKVFGSIEARRYVGDILTDVQAGKRLSATPQNGEFSVVPMKEKSKDVIEVTYSTVGENNIIYSVKEYFVISDEAYLKLSFYEKENDNTRNTLYKGLLQEIDINN